MNRIFLKIKDNVWLGLLSGLALPSLLLVLVHYIKQKFIFLQQDDLLYIACVVVNFPILLQAFKVRKEQFAKGVVGATFICALIFVYYKLFFRV